MFRTGSLASGSIALLLTGLMAVPAAGGDTRLIDAIKDADPTTIRALLPVVDANARAGDGATALHWAAYTDDLSTAELLMGAGATVNAVNDLGVTPLWVACTNASTSMARTLLTAGADPNVGPPTGGSPLMVAVRTGVQEMVALLLAHGADVDATEGAHGQTALMWAVAQHHPEIVGVLLAAGADVHARSTTFHQVVMTCCPRYNGDSEGIVDVEQGGFTPLIFAAREGDVESATRLLAAGANANDAAPPGTSALVMAAHSGHGALARLLLKHGADPHAAYTGYTALHAAVLRGDLQLAETLLAHDADPNARLTKGTPARRNGGGGDAFDKAWIGATPFLLASKFLDLALMRAVAAAGADVLVPMEDGTTPVMAALYSQGERIRPGTDTAEPRVRETVTLAIELGADVDAVDRAGDTALHIAAKKKSPSLVELLADSGAQFSLANHRGETPLTLALTDFCGYGPGRTAVVCGEKGFGSYAVEGYRPLAALVADDSSTADMLRQLGAKE